MGTQRNGHSKEFGPFAALLAVLVFFIALVPLVEEGGVGGTFVRLGFTAVLIVGLGVTRGSRRLLGIAVVLVVANLVVQWLAHLLTGDGADRELLRLGFGASYLAVLIVVLVRSLSRQREASIDTVLGGINVYLLLALAFMELHLLVEQLAPGSYVHGGVALSDSACALKAALPTTLFYFRFTTLTTLGYGDIAPARPVAQFLCSAEAVIGQLYVAIFIGGLVALRIGARQAASPEESTTAD